MASRPTVVRRRCARRIPPNSSPCNPATFAGLICRRAFPTVRLKPASIASTRILGTQPRTGVRARSTTTGEAHAKRIVANVDFGITVHLTDKLRLIDTFRFSNFRIPGSWDSTTLSFFNG